MAPVSILWLMLATGLLLLALAGAEVDGLLPAAAVALVLSVAAAWLPLPPMLQLGLLAGLTGLGVLGLRRWSAGQRDRSLSPVETATVLSGFNGSDTGRVRWHGQSWSAVNLGSSQAFIPGAAVTVLGREGNQLQVLGPGRD
ncbi:MAG: NfeD family protein [Cyanobacteria bacterium]|nr:NfeD family protein [Cyanobacteriota bacterium]MDA1246606.1 NfeD family protein [Cyanobacteriota bacterium]